MGQLYSKLNQLVLNDVETAADPDRPREKLETAFTTPARPFQTRVADPRSATQYIDRTPIYVTVNTVSAGDTPKAPKTVARPRYLETDLDEVLPDSSLDLDKVLPESQLDVDKDLPDCSVDLDKVLTDSPLDLGKVLTESPLDLDKARTESQLDLGEVLPSPELHTSTGQHPGDVVEVILEEGNESLQTNWSGIAGPDRSIGTEAELAAQNFMGNHQTEINTVVQDWILDQQFQIADDSNQSILGSTYCSVGTKTELATQNFVDVSQEISTSLQDWILDQPSHIADAQDQSDSLVVHNSESFTQHSGELEWDDDSLLVFSPSVKLDMENAMKTVYVTPKKPLLTNKSGGRTPLGDVSTNSPVIQSSTPKPPTKILTAIDNKLWKNVRDERLKRGMDAENTPPHTAFNSYPPEVVQSAPGKIRTRNNKTKWSNDSLLI